MSPQPLVLVPSHLPSISCHTYASPPVIPAVFSGNPEEEPETPGPPHHRVADGTKIMDSRLHGNDRGRDGHDTGRGRCDTGRGSHHTGKREVAFSGALVICSRRLALVLSLPPSRSLFSPRPTPCRSRVPPSVIPAVFSGNPEEEPETPGPFSPPGGGRDKDHGFPFARE